MAASIKFSYCLLIMLSSVWIFTAQLIQVGKATTEITKLSKTQKELMVTSATVNLDHSRIFGGRKMALHKVMKQAKAKEQVVTESNNSNVSASNSNQGVEGHEFGRQKVDCTDQQAVAVRFDEAAGFVAFNADYSAPRRHPPKNN